MCTSWWEPRKTGPFLMYLHTHARTLVGQIPPVCSGFHLQNITRDVWQRKYVTYDIDTIHASRCVCEFKHTLTDQACEWYFSTAFRLKWLLYYHLKDFWGRRLVWWLVEINSNKVDAFFSFVFGTLTEYMSTLVRANVGATGGISVCVVSLDSVCVCVYEEVRGWGLGSLMIRIKGLLNCEGQSFVRLTHIPTSHKDTHTECTHNLSGTHI